MRKQTNKQQSLSEKLMYKLLFGESEREETKKCVQCGRTAPLNYELGLCLTCIRLNQFKAGSRRRRSDTQRD